MATASQSKGSKPPRKPPLGHRWKKGQSGNPRGSSRKARRRRLLRDWLRDGLQEAVTQEEAALIGLTESDLDALREEGRPLTRGDIIGEQVISRALLGNEKAIDQILQGEPRAVELGGMDPEEGGEPVRVEALPPAASAWLAQVARALLAGRPLPPPPEGVSLPPPAAALPPGEVPHEAAPGATQTADHGAEEGEARGRDGSHLKEK